jgi:methionine-rich copper-binding protein CopC
MIDSSVKHSPSKRRAIVSAIFVAVLLCHSSAFGHARLVRSQPAANATLKQSPKSVELWFSEELEPTASAIVVTDQSGKRVDKNNATVAEGNKKLQIDLDEVGSGTYTVEWKALATDQHMMKGKFTFNVAVAEKASNTSTPTQVQNQNNNRPAQTPPASPQAAESTEESGSSWMMSFVRWLQYLAMMSLVGGFALRLLVLGPALRVTGGSVSVAGKTEALTLGQSRILFLSWVSIVLLLISTVIALVQQASTVFDKSIGESLSPSVLSDLLTKTGYGGAWFLQVGSTLILMIILLLLSLGLKRAPTKEHTRYW